MNIDIFRLVYLFLIIFTSCSKTIPNLELNNGDSRYEKLEKVDQWLLDLSMKKKFNGAILISRHGEIDLMKTYGFSDLDRTKPLTYQSSFRLASVSKQFTAMAVMILKDKGQIDFDDAVNLYLKTFPYEDVTIRHLLTHTSGIPDYENLVLNYKNKSSTKYFFKTGQSKENITYSGIPSRYKNLYDILSMKDVLELVVQYSDKKKFRTGEKFSYSNTGYVLLAYLVEQISGETFENFMDKEIFRPLEMENSSVWNLNTQPRKLNDRVQGTNKGRLNDYTWMDGIAGDGAVFVSIEDFIKWDRSLFNCSLISKATCEEGVNPFVTLDGDTSYYGFGWILSNESSSMDHTGGWVGASTYIYRNPDNGLLFVILDSSTNKNMRKIRESILDLIENDYF